MRQYFLRWGLATLLLMAALPARAASEWGPLLANNILGGATSGVLVGLSVGTLAYGLDNNYDPQVLLNGSVYGLLAGALAGGGVGVYEISTKTPDNGLAVLEYTAGGTGIGAALGLIVALIPYMRDGDPEDFTIGLGLGGVIGATLGLATAAVDIGSRTAEGDRKLSGQFGIIEVTAFLPTLIPELKQEPTLNCKLVKLAF